MRQPSLFTIQMIRSGGQTGVDRAALDFALHQGIDHCGWCPKGRLAADGPLPARYRLQETDSAGYRQRTQANVRDSDATLILNLGALTGGSRLTQEFIRKLGKPGFIWQLEAPFAPQQTAFHTWLSQHSIQELNVAGPSEGRCPGIYHASLALLARLWEGAG
ncbi:putative molybdenum carrier protein [Pseudaeromonas sp. ZJS20]|uniref:putative molybdenum carrier protein n=1 Tax=Pseudaeromonas aegiceratis TaxID=3153928 RepID=UPI00390C4236